MCSTYCLTIDFAVVHWLDSTSDLNFQEWDPGIGRHSGTCDESVLVKYGSEGRVQWGTSCSEERIQLEASISHC
jgi:hypothetical protein